MKTNFEIRVLKTMNDFGYEFRDNTLIAKGVRGFLSPKIIGKFSSYFSAAEYLIPIICDDKYTQMIVGKQ